MSTAGNGGENSDGAHKGMRGTAVGVCTTVGGQGAWGVIEATGSAPQNNEAANVATRRSLMHRIKTAIVGLIYVSMFSLMVLGMFLFVPAPRAANATDVVTVSAAETPEGRAGFTLCVNIDCPNQHKTLHYCYTIGF